MGPAGSGGEPATSCHEKVSPVLMEVDYAGLKFKASAGKSIFHQQKEKSKTELRFHKGLIIPANNSKQLL